MKNLLIGKWRLNVEFAKNPKKGKKKKRLNLNAVSWVRNNLLELNHKLLRNRARLT